MWMVEWNLVREKEKEREGKREKQKGKERRGLCRKEQIKRGPPRYPRTGGENGARREVATIALKHGGGDVAIGHVPEPGNKKTNRQSTRCFRYEGYYGNNVSAVGYRVSRVSLPREREHRGGLTSGRRSGG